MGEGEVAVIYKNKIMWRGVHVEIAGTDLAPADYVWGI